MNTFGRNLRITTFGESHGAAIGVVIDGLPAGINFDEVAIQADLDRRRPGQSAIVTQRQETDTFSILSGVFEGKTMGTPILLLIGNNDARTQDYAHLREAFRPSHADYTYFHKYGGFHDYRGGGRSSARETAARVAAGAVAKLLLRQHNISITAYVQQIGAIVATTDYATLDFANIEKTPVRCPDLAVAAEMLELVRTVKKAGDTVGGVVQCVIQGCPVGLGEPIFDKLHARLAAAMLGIPAAKGFEYGSGFAGAAMFGSAHNDIFVRQNDTVQTLTNHSGGIQGGISNGMDIPFRVAFKPVATLLRPQPSIDAQGNAITLQGRGRHDPCVLPRAVPIVEAMAALVVADFLLA